MAGRDIDSCCRDCVVMRFVIPGCNVKVFGRAVHSLARFGDELYFEPLKEGLSLRTVNSSRSAFACFLLSPLFFQSYEWNSTENKAQDDDQDQDQGFNCRLNMKAVVSVFHSLVGIERSVDRCKIQLDLPACRLVFQLHCRYGITKTHNLTFQDCESLHAVYSKSQCRNVFRAQAKLLVDSVIHFQMNQEEVTLGVTQTKVSLRNYLEEEIDVGRATLTCICLNRQEFEHFTAGVDTEVTFCLKELRGVLNFAEASNLSVSIHFESAGRPIIFSVEDSILEATFILATLMDALDSQPRTLPSERELGAHAANKRPIQEILDEEMASMDTSGMITSADDAQNELPTSPTIPARARVTQSPADEMTEPNEEFEGDKNEGTPPQKKFRSLFFAALSKPSCVLGETISGQPVLAEDSGSESDPN
uniref:cell cycle checkpoint control protein RAD9A isoform X2 n=1 Tax=Myxine glutinosa TaxID=7769 RepID=UPI00358F029C